MSVPPDLGHYKVLRPLGRGGMGEVYAAEDTRLRRQVAIKLLPTSLADDPERQRRLEREAQSIAALNHPGIVTIHAIDEFERRRFIVMELVDGTPLDELLLNGPLSFEKTLQVGLDVSTAIGLVHERGITHRDLKPANVMLAADGRVKVLDFGLAKATADVSGNESVTHLPPADLTGTGTIVGTVAYMSPEQAQGQPVDGRSDIFSLGVMLYEMATGQRPFAGATSVAVIASILRETPRSITELNPRLPDGLARVIRRALEKDPSRRYQSAFDLRNDLEELQHEPAEGSRPKPTPRPTRARLTTQSLLMVAAAALAAAVAVWLGSRESAATRPFEIDRLTRLTTAGTSLTAAISPDRRHVVHTKRAGQLSELWVRQTATQSDVRIVDPSPDRYLGLTFSPDGDHVYYVTTQPATDLGRLYRVAALGGQPQLLLEDIDSRVSLAPDGQRIAFMRGDPAQGRTLLMTANTDGTDVHQIATTEAPDRFRMTAPSWAPDGKSIVVAAQSSLDGPHHVCFVVDVESGKRTAVGGKWSTAADVQWLPDGRAFLVAAAEFGAITPQIWEITLADGTRCRVTNDLSRYAGISLSFDGQAIVTVQIDNGSNIWLVPIDAPDEPAQLTRGRNRRDGQLGLVWTHDGRLVFSSTASGRLELWAMKADGSNPRQLTDNAASSLGPTVSPDGRFIVFQRYRPDGMDLIRIDADGSRPTPVTTGGIDFEPVFSRDGQSIYFNSLATGVPQPFRISIDGGERTRLSSDYFRPFEVSPDGRLLLGVGLDVNLRRRDLATMPIAGGAITVLGLGVTDGTWAPDGSVTYADARDNISNVWIRDRKTGKSRQLTRFTEGELGWFWWAPDGKQLAVSHGVDSSDVVLISRK